MVHKSLPNSRKLFDYEGSAPRVPLIYLGLDRVMQCPLLYKAGYTVRIKAWTGRFLRYNRGSTCRGFF